VSWFADSCVDENDELAFLQGSFIANFYSIKTNPIQQVAMKPLLI
jgi:hypothetical protein